MQKHYLWDPDEKKLFRRYQECPWCERDLPNPYCKKCGGKGLVDMYDPEADEILIEEEMN